MTTEEKREYNRTYRAANRDKLILYFKEWRKANPEKAKAASKAWNQAHRDELLLYFKDYYKKNAGLKKLRAKKYRQANPEKIRDWNAARRAKVKGARTGVVYRAKIHNYQSRLCGICSALIEGKYHLDHIIPLSKGGVHETSNLQLTHPSCNMSKQARSSGSLLS